MAEASAPLVSVLTRTDGAPALIDPISSTVLSHADLHQQIRASAAQLRGLGVGAGDRVALVTANSPELVITFLALTALGAAAAPLNPAFSSNEIAAEMADLHTGLLLSGPPATDVAAAAAAGRGVPHHVITRSSSGAITIEGASPAEGPLAGDGDSVALLLHTSGTTSRPKTVPLRQRNLAHSVRTVAAAYGLTADDVSYCVMPLFHIHGLVAATLAALSAGGAVVVPPKFSGAAFWDDIKRFGASWYTAVPTIHHVVLSVAGGDRPDHGLRFVRSCSSTLPPPLWRRFEDAVGVPLVEAYGMTEAAHQMATNPLPPGERRPGTVGQATGIEVAVLDDNWAPVPPGTPGEVSVRGASVVDGYLDNPEANAASFRDGWFRTGDVGTLSEDGYLTLVGRIKELINRGGEKISPYEVEAALLEHPAVSEAAAYPVPDEKYGEQVGAVVVPSRDVEVAELLAHCANRLVAFKVPSQLSIRQEIPKGPTGKIQRRLLADLV